MNNQRSLALALLIILLVFFVELAGGFISNSLALLSDAGHMLTDAMALALSLFAAIIATRPASREKTFGFYRWEILAALLNGIFLALIALFIFSQAYQKFAHPAEVGLGIMMMVAGIGLFANIGAAVILAQSSRASLNVRGAFLHVISNLVSSVGVIVCGIVMHYTLWYWLDPVVAVLIGLLILFGAFRLVLESVNVLLEGAPKGMDVAAVAAAIKGVKGVKDIHDLHIWTITSGLNALSAHLVIDDKETTRASQILKEINAKLNSAFRIQHSTFQTECESCPEGLICRLEPSEREHGHSH